MKRHIQWLLLLMTIVSCSEEKKHLGYDIELWKDTEVWNFASYISNNDFEKAEELLSCNSYDVDFREPKFGETLLSWAILNDNVEAVNFLLDHGANPNSHNTYNGESPMTDAAGGFHSVEILKYLLSHGGNPNDYVKETENLSYRSKETPLTKAASTSLEKTKMLVEAGADPNFTIEPGMTPFYKAAHRIEVLEYLLLNCKFDYRKTFIETIDGDTLFLKEILEKDKVAYRRDSIRIKRILKYIDDHFPETKKEYG